MRLRALTVAALAMLFAGSRAAAADETKAIVEKAIKAHGHEAVAKQPAATMKMKGKWYGMGDGLEYTGVWQGQSPDRLRFEISMSIMNQNFTVIQGVKGDKGWVAINGKVEDMPKEVFEEHREALHARVVENLLCLRGKEYTLSALGESKVGNRPAVGVRVERKGYRDVNLFFDKENHLLLKLERREKDPMMGGDKEFTTEVFMHDYKKVDGALVPHKIEVHRDGKLYVDGETTEFTRAEKFDDALLTKP